MNVDVAAQTKAHEASVLEQLVVLVLMPALPCALYRFAFVDLNEAMQNDGVVAAAAEVILFRFLVLIILFIDFITKQLTYPHTKYHKQNASLPFVLRSCLPFQNDLISILLSVKNLVVQQALPVRPEQ